MASLSPSHDADLAARNRRTGWQVAGVVAFMLGLSYAAVPLYDLFCRTTGFGGTPLVATKPATRTGTKPYVVRLDSSVAPGLNWRFEAESVLVTLLPGEMKTVHYTVHNQGQTETTGIANFNVLPEITGGFFNKLQCFCFTDVTLKAGEKREETVVFFLDPAIETDPSVAHVDTLTLSYTFFAAKSPVKPLASTVQENGKSVQ